MSVSNIDGDIDGVIVGDDDESEGGAVTASDGTDDGVSDSSVDGDRDSDGDDDDADG